MPPKTAPIPPPPVPGLKANAPQFALLMIINAFVGGMVGLERTVVPLLGAREFHLALNASATGFIAAFGIAKALTNLWSGAMADRYGRKPIMVLGWLIGLPVPFLIIFAHSWGWIIAANVLLGMNQGLTWSMAVVMKIDLAGPRNRGLAVGLNEFTGYLSVGATAWATGYLASRFGLRPYPFYLGIAYAVLGLAFSVVLLRDTAVFAKPAASAARFGAGLRKVFAETSWRDRTLFSASQAGLINNLNDGMTWGLFPLYFASKGLDVEGIGTLKSVYPAVWGLSQLATGPLSDRLGRKPLIVWGMLLQAFAIGWVAAVDSFRAWIGAGILLGLGTAMVYPALLAVVGDRTPPDGRAAALGVYRFWRDSGYAIGALLSGFIADALGFTYAILVVAALTFLSGIQVAMGMRKGGRPD